MVDISRKTRNTRALIRKAAAKEFAEKGFAGARVARISREAGVNKQLIFYYFHSKAGLFDSVVASAGESLAPDPAATIDEAEQFRSAFRGLFDSMASDPEMTKILFFASDTSNERRKSTIHRMVAVLSDCVSRGQGLGRYRDDVDPHVVAQQAVILLIGYFATEDVALSDDVNSQQHWLQTTNAMLNGWISW